MNMFKKLSLLYLLGLCLLLAVGTSAAVSALTASTTISSDIGPVISLLTTSGTVNINVTPTGSGAQTISSDTVTVSTDDTAGYTLQLAESGASTALISGARHITNFVRDPDDTSRHGRHTGVTELIVLAVSALGRRHLRAVAQSAHPPSSPAYRPLVHQIL